MRRKDAQCNSMASTKPFWRIRLRSTKKEKKKRTENLSGEYCCSDSRSFPNRLETLFGSTAEDLKCFEPYDVRDVELMIFPDSDSFLIHDKLIEYLPDSALHVRIKAGEHPLL